MKHDYDVKLGERTKLDTGSVRYPLKVVCKDNNEVIVDTTYTVSPRQEEKLEKMVKTFANKKAKEYEENQGQDHSNKEISL